MIFGIEDSIKHSQNQIIRDKTTMAMLLLVVAVH